MRILIFTLLFLTLCLIARFCNQEKAFVNNNPTEINNLLENTTWLTNSKNQIDARGFGLYPVKIFSKCITDRYELEKDRLTKLEVSDSLIYFEFKLVENCCFSFIADFEVVHDTSLNLIAQGYGTLCGCKCLHKLSYIIEIRNFDKIKELKFVTLNGKLKTKLRL